MNEPFAEDFDLDRLVRVKAARFGFDLFTVPRFVKHYAGQAYEEMTALLVRQNASGICAFLDVGAHHGFYSVLVGLRNPHCRILAFEPVPGNLEILRRNLAIHGLAAETVPCAAADRDGPMPFQVSQASDRSGFIANPTAPILRTVAVQAVRLDQYVDRLVPGPVLVKIDVEGGETSVLQGMSGLFAQIEDLRIVLEFNPHCLEANGVSPQSLLAQLGDLGYVAFAMHEEERQYEKVDLGRDWHSFLGDRRHVNLFCQRKERSLSLCFFSPSSALGGGSERSLLELTGNLVSEHGSLCSVVVPRRGSLAEALEERGVPALPLEVGPWCSSAPLPAETAFESMHRSYYRLRFFLPELERLSPDLFLTDTAAVPWGAVAALLLDRPHVWMIRELGDLDPGPFYPLGRLVDTIREASNHLVVGSEALRSALFPGMDPSQCSVAYPAHIDLPALEGTRPAVSRLPDSTKLFIADPIPPGNGLEDALGAAAELIRLGYRLELCLAGGENEGDAAELKALGEREGLTPFIHDIGPASDARAFLQQADIGLSCSPSPGLGRAVIEALLLGKPVVCSDTGGAAELIADGVSGLVYSPGDREQLVEKLRFFLDHPERIRQFGDRARQDLFSKLSRHADDQVIAQIGLALVGQPNPYSSHLLRLMLDWEHGESEAQYREQIEGLTQRARRAETLAAARERELKDIRRTRAWRIAQFCWKVRARLFPGGSARKEGRN